MLHATRRVFADARLFRQFFLFRQLAIRLDFRCSSMFHAAEGCTLHATPAGFRFLLLLRHYACFI